MKRFPNRLTLAVFLFPLIGVSGCSLVVNTDLVAEIPTLEACATRIGPVGEPDVVTFGAVLPVQGEFSSIGIPMQNALELALTDINDAGGLGNGRRLGIVVCDSSGSRDQGLEVANYLVDVIGVPLIIGPAFSGIFIDVSTQITAPAGVMTLSPSATSPVIGGLDDDGLAWRTAASDEFQGVAISDLVRARGFGRVIALGKADAYGRGLLGQVNSNLGTTLNETSYASAEYADPGSVENPDFATPILEALAVIPSPDVVLLLGTNEVADLMRLFESQFETTGTATSARPRYVFADGGKVQENLDEVEGAPSLIDRIEGTEADHRAAPLYARFALAFQQRFRAAPGIYTSNSYDAVYLAAYGAMTLDGTTFDGRQLAASMARLVDGSGASIDAGPAGVGQARMRLMSGGSIDYNGVSGRLDFDLARGEAPANVSLWQIGRGTTGALRFSPTPAGSYVIREDGRGEWTLAP